jgi:hypothetical protein
MNGCEGLALCQCGVSWYEQRQWIQFVSDLFMVYLHSSLSDINQDVFGAHMEQLRTVQLTWLMLPQERDQFCRFIDRDGPEGRDVGP